MQPAYTRMGHKEKRLEYESSKTFLNYIIIHSLQ